MIWCRTGWPVKAEITKSILQQQLDEKQQDLNTVLETHFRALTPDMIGSIPIKQVQWYIADKIAIPFLTADLLQARTSGNPIQSGREDRCYQGLPATKPRLHIPARLTTLRPVPGAALSNSGFVEIPLVEMTTSWSPSGSNNGGKAIRRTANWLVGLRKRWNARPSTDALDVGSPVNQKRIEDGIWYGVWLTHLSAGLREVVSELDSSLR